MRIAITNGAKAWSQVERFLCCGCRRSFTQLTHLLLPFKHYVAEEIEEALRHVFRGGEISKTPSGASESTLRRWRDEFQSKIQEWSGRLEEILDIPKAGLIRWPDPLRRLEEVMSRLPPLPGKWPVMTGALWWLSKPHPL